MYPAKARRYSLKALARILEEARYLAVVESTVVNTDRKIGRLRRPGKGRKGLQLTVYRSTREPVLKHNNAETYRHRAK